jgi:hypothetical protein
LQVNGARSCPGAAKTRLLAPHFPHTASMRVPPCLTVMDLRSIASLISRSLSSRISCFDGISTSSINRYVSSEDASDVPLAPLAAEPRHELSACSFSAKHKTRCHSSFFTSE